jgi:protein-tyrosine phosphatase
MKCHSVTDTHCHLLPGLDDGPKSWQITLGMARLAVTEGIQTVVATPHQLGRYESNTAERIRTVAAEAQRRLARAGIPLTVLPGADVRVREDLPELLKRGEVLTLADNHKYLLLELPHDIIIPLESLLCRLRHVGIRCILSHPERHRPLMHKLDLVHSWVQQDCLIQLTSGSITGHFGPVAQRMSRRLLDAGLVHLVATDAHDMACRLPLVGEAYRQACRWIGEPAAERLFVINLRAIVRGGSINASISQPNQKPQRWWS